MIWYSYLFTSFPRFVTIHTIKGFSVVNETEVDVFLEFPCFLYDPVRVGNLISGSTFSKPSLDVWKFLVCIILKPSMQDFKHDLTSMGDECNCPVAWTVFSSALLGNSDEYWPFPILWLLLDLSDLLIYCMHLIASSFRVLTSCGFPSHPLIDSSVS